MKQLLLLFVLSISLNSSAQSLKDSTIEQFCILRVGFSADFSSKITITLDYGQESAMWGWNKNAVKEEETGKVKKFNSISDGLNYLGKLGWKLVTAVPIIGDKTSSTDYIFKKEFKVTSLE